MRNFREISVITIVVKLIIYEEMHDWRRLTRKLFCWWETIEGGQRAREEAEKNVEKEVQKSTRKNGEILAWSFPRNFLYNYLIFEFVCVHWASLLLPYAANSLSSLVFFLCGDGEFNWWNSPENWNNGKKKEGWKLISNTFWYLFFQSRERKKHDRAYKEINSQLNVRRSRQKIKKSSLEHSISIVRIKQGREWVCACPSGISTIKIAKLPPKWWPDCAPVKLKSFFRITPNSLTSDIERPPHFTSSRDDGLTLLQQ